MATLNSAESPVTPEKDNTAPGDAYVELQRNTRHNIRLWPGHWSDTAEAGNDIIMTVSARGRQWAGKMQTTINFQSSSIFDIDTCSEKPPPSTLLRRPLSLLGFFANQTIHCTVGGPITYRWQLCIGNGYKAKQIWDNFLKGSLAMILNNRFLKCDGKTICVYPYIEVKIEEMSLISFTAVMSHCPAHLPRSFWQHCSALRALSSIFPRCRIARHTFIS